MSLSPKNSYNFQNKSPSSRNDNINNLKNDLNNSYSICNQYNNRELNPFYVSQLKTKIFDLEQNLRNYDELQEKFKKSKNENEILSKNNIDLDYKLKQKTENSLKNISKLENENENIKNKLKEKILINKQLYDENKT